MKKFRYRLERILTLKETLKRQAQKEFAEAEANRQKQSLILESLKTELGRRLESEKEGRKKRLDITRLTNLQRYLGQLSFLIGHQTRVLARARELVELKRRKLVGASREERKYERLKEIRQEEYTRLLEGAQQKETDEFARNICRRKTLETP